MRKSLILITIAISLALILAACGGGESAEPEQPPEESVPAGDAEAGEVVFQGTCSACHGPDAKGLPNLGKDMTTSTFIAETSDADLLAFVKHGRPVTDPANTTGVDMPPKGGNPALSDEDILNVIAYIRTVQE
jgi:mono/diheme cytochrome c family protein